MRVRRKWNLLADSTHTQIKITVEHEGLNYTVRVLKVVLSNGETETLLTSLNQKLLPIRDAGELYFKHWAIETAYDLLKSKLQLENFSGKSKVSVMQDFYATMFLSKLAAFAVGIADEQIAQNDHDKDLKHPRQANRNRAISKLRDSYFVLITEPDPALRDEMLEHLFSTIARYPVPVVCGRSPARKKPRAKRFHLARKSPL